MTDVIRWDENAGLRAGCGVRSQVIDVLEAQIKRRPAMNKVSSPWRNCLCFVTGDKACGNGKMIQGADQQRQ
jgi:hypothetical protein